MQEDISAKNIELKGNKWAHDREKVGVEVIYLKKLKTKQCGFEKRNPLQGEIGGCHAEK